jgi:hypothetical protein
MSKLARLVAASSLTVTLLTCVFVAIAALDELARFPFYHTLLVTTLAVNATSLFYLLRKRRFGELARGLLASLHSAAAALLGRLSFIFADFQRQEASPTWPNACRSHRSLQSTSQETKSALRKIHSVAWGFPTCNVPAKTMVTREH